VTADEPWGGGRVRALGGPGPTAVDLADLDAAGAGLRAAAAALQRADAHLRRAATSERDRLSSRTALGSPEPPSFDLHRADVLAHGAADTSRGVADLLRRLSRVVRYYDEAESWAARAVRMVLTLDAHLLGEAPGAMPFVTPFVAPVLAPSILGAGIAVARGEADLLVGGAARKQVPSALGGPMSGLLRGALPGVRAPVADPLPRLAAEVAGGDPGPSVLVPRADPAALPAPRTAADVLRNVGASYPAGHGGRPGTPHSTISLQRLTHPDGSRGWVVAIPGTQSGSFGGAVATDMATNARLVAGLPDDMSSGVLNALRDADVPADEPVVLAGHSQGGMVAVAAAALAGGAYDIRAVLTAGSPDVPRRVPPGIQVRHYRIEEDLVPQADGRADTVGRDVVAVRRSIGAANLDTAHALDEYVRTAELTDVELAGSPALRGFDAELARVLGPEGTTAETWQFAVTRDPAVVATDPATGQRRVPVLRAAP
jgi:hypothetical protein